MKGLINYELKKMFSVWWLVYAAATLLAFYALDWEAYYGFFFALASVHVSKGVSDTTRADEKSGWLALQGMLPVSKRQYLTAKYVRYGVVCVLNVCFVFTLIGIRCVLSDNFGLLTFWLPLMLHLSFCMAISSTFPEILGLKGHGLRAFLIRNGLLLCSAGNAVSLIVLVSNPAWENRLLPFVIGFLVVGAAVCVLSAKAKLDQFEDYQLGISSELQREDT